MTLLRIVPRPWNEPEVEVVAEVAIYRKHSQARSQLGMIFQLLSLISKVFCFCQTMLNIFDERPAGHSSRLPQVTHAVDMVEFKVRLHIFEKIVIFLFFSKC